MSYFGIMRDFVLLFGNLCRHKLFNCDLTYFSIFVVGNVEFNKLALAT